MFWTNGCSGSDVPVPMEEEREDEEEAEAKTCSLVAKRLQSWSWYLKRMMCCRQQHDRRSRLLMTDDEVDVAP